MNPRLLALLLLGVGVLFATSCANNVTSSSPDPTATLSPTSTVCVNANNTPCTSTSTFTPTSTATGTSSSTPTNSSTKTDTLTITSSPTITNTPTITGTPTNTLSPTPTASPTITSTNTPTLTPTLTPCPWTPSVPYTATPSPTAFTLPAGIYVQGFLGHGKIITSGYNYDGPDVIIYLAVNQVAVSTAGVTVSDSFGSSPLTYSGNSTTGGNLTATYSAVGSIAIQPGQACTLIVNTTAGTATAISTIPGNITQAADGSSTNWISAGDHDQVFVQDGSGYTTFWDGPSPEAVSPVTLPGSAYPHCGPYLFVTAAIKEVIPSNAASGSIIDFVDEYVNGMIYK